MSRWRRAVIANVLTELRSPGQSRSSGSLLWETGQLLLTAVVATTNVVGIAAVLAIVDLVIPLPPIAAAGHVKAVNAVTAGVCIVIALPLGAWLGNRMLRPIKGWLVAERPATDAEQRLVLLGPLRLFLLQIGLWLVAAAVFAGIDAQYSGRLSLALTSSIAIGGLVTATCAYLLTERVLRAATVRALTSGLPDRVAVPGVASRAILAWALGSGLPVLAIVAVGALYLGGGPARPAQLAEAMVTLGGIAVAVGVLAVTLAARATASPLDEVRRSLERVERGDFEAHVGVYDGTQVGRLQHGFNQMVLGLGERERLRQAFGAYVDPDVAERIMGQEDVHLEGEQVEVSVMFLDVKGFTHFAEQRPAQEVVAVLNRLFERVVPVIQAHGGRVDKFVGDGLLAVFGAPRRLPDHADQAVATALELAALSDGDGIGLPFGIGVNSGVVVAGNVGGGGRLEFSVIGDPVNVAARVEAATRQTGDTVLVAERTKELARNPAWHMVERHGLTLRGKTSAVRVYHPERSDPERPDPERPDPERPDPERPRPERADPEPSSG